HFVSEALGLHNLRRLGHRGLTNQANRRDEGRAAGPPRSVRVEREVRPAPHDLRDQAPTSERPTITLRSLVISSYMRPGRLSASISDACATSNCSRVATSDLGKIVCKRSVTLPDGSAGPLMGASRCMTGGGSAAWTKAE